jgi:hypothetical protein
MGRYKRIIGPQLRAKSFAGQQTEAAIGVVVLNRMLRPVPRIPSVPSRKPHDPGDEAHTSLFMVSVQQRQLDR